MGRRGPAREPDAAKLARGETRPSRLNGLEPLPALRKPRMPSDMDDRAKAVWRWVLRSVGDTGLVTEADGPILRLYCDAVSRYETAQRLYLAGTPVVKDRGHLAKNPLAQVVRDNADQVRLLARELGLSPAARANLRVSVGPEDTGIADDLEPRARLRLVGG